MNGGENTYSTARELSQPNIPTQKQTVINCGEQIPASKQSFLRSNSQQRVLEVRDSESYGSGYHSGPDNDQKLRR